MDIVIDFDGTVVSHMYPVIGRDIGAIPVLKELIEEGHKLILFTMRCGKPLEEAVEWFEKNQIPLHGIQRNPTQKTTSPKAYGKLIIDDAALGCPLVSNYDERDFVDWVKVREILIKSGVIKHNSK